jgi:hypothetical protein
MTILALINFGNTFRKRMQLQEQEREREEAAQATATLPSQQQQPPSRSEGGNVAAVMGREQPPPPPQLSRHIPQGNEDEGTPSGDVTPSLPTFVVSVPNLDPASLSDLGYELDNNDNDNDINEGNYEVSNGSAPDAESEVIYYAGEEVTSYHNEEKEEKEVTFLMAEARGITDEVEGNERGYVILPSEVTYGIEPGGDDNKNKVTSADYYSQVTYTSMEFLSESSDEQVRAEAEAAEEEGEGEGEITDFVLEPSAQGLRAALTILCSYYTEHGVEDPLLNLITNALVTPTIAEAEIAAIESGGASADFTQSHQIQPVVPPSALYLENITVTKNESEDKLPLSETETATPMPEPEPELEERVTTVGDSILARAEVEAETYYYATQPEVTPDSKGNEAAEKAGESHGDDEHTKGNEEPSPSFDANVKAGSGESGEVTFVPATSGNNTNARQYVLDLLARPENRAGGMLANTLTKSCLEQYNVSPKGRGLGRPKWARATLYSGYLRYRRRQLTNNRNRPIPAAKLPLLVNL